jgi:hypothetical protein
VASAGTIYLAELLLAISAHCPSAKESRPS